MVKFFQIHLNNYICQRSRKRNISNLISYENIVQNDFDNRTYSCVHCRANLAKHSDLLSKSFQGSQGRAYLFKSVVNVDCGKPEDRLLLTGLHSVADIFCQCCKISLGWKYEHAFLPSQKYKEGKYIVELAHIVKDNGWDYDIELKKF